MLCDHCAVVHYLRTTLSAEDYKIWSSVVSEGQQSANEMLHELAADPNVLTEEQLRLVIRAAGFMLEFHIRIRALRERGDLGGDITAAIPRSSEEMSKEEDCRNRSEDLCGIIGGCTRHRSYWAIMMVQGVYIPADKVVSASAVPAGSMPAGARAELPIPEKKNPAAANKAGKPAKFNAPPQVFCDGTSRCDVRHDRKNEA